MDKSALRKTFRRIRSLQTVDEQEQAAQFVCHQMQQQSFWLQAKKIAFYLANDHELDPKYLFMQAQEKKQQCFLPYISPDQNRIIFLSYQPNELLEKNHFGIFQPVYHIEKEIKPEDLDIVFAPLVAFTQTGKRLGMGGGFYDATFHFKKQAKKPILIGLAYDCQEVSDLSIDSWDIYLDYVCTPTRWIKCTIGL